MKPRKICVLTGMTLALVTQAFFLVPTTAAAASHFVDNGDGTITDTQTGLMWEKKDKAGGLHDIRSKFVWAGLCSTNRDSCQPSAAAASACEDVNGDIPACNLCQMGTCITSNHGKARRTIWEWVVALNESHFAGYSDWRIPAVGKDGSQAELETIFSFPLCKSQRACVTEFQKNCKLGCIATS